MRYIFQSVFKDGQGRIIPSATISVYLAGTTTSANVYTASTGGSPVTSVTTTTDGSFSFFVSDSDFSLNQKFKITMTKTDFATKTYDNITIFAPVPTGVYYPDVNATDQGAATTGGYSLKDIIDAAGSNNITIKFRNSSGSATTSYTLTTSETIPANCSIEFEIGARIAQGGSALLTINGPIVGNPMHQLFYGFSAGDVVIEGISNPEVWSEWWGAVGDSTGATGNGTDNGVPINCAIKAILGATHKPTLRFTGGNYRFTQVLNFTPTAQVTGFKVDGNAPRGSLSGSQATTCTRLVWDGVDSARANTSTVIIGDRINNWLAMGFDVQGISITKATGNTSTVIALELNIGSCTFRNVTAYGCQRGIDFNGIDNVMIGVTGTENGIGLAFYHDYGNTTTKNYFYACAFSYNSQQGIMDTCSAGTEMHGCDLEFNGREAIRIDISTSNEGNNFTLYGGHIEGNSLDSASYPQQIFVKGHTSATYDNFKIIDTSMQMAAQNEVNPPYRLGTATRHVYIERCGNVVIKPKWMSLVAPTTAHIYDGGNNLGVEIDRSITTTDGGGNTLPLVYPQGNPQHATVKSAYVFSNCGLILDSVNHSLVIPRMSTAQRDALAGYALVSGAMIYNSTLNKFQCYQSGAWINFGYVQQAANADTSGATLGQLETEVNEVKQALRNIGLLA